MTEQEIKLLIVQLYTGFLTRLDAETPADPDEIAECAEMLADQFIRDMKEAGELDRLLSLSPEEIRELFNYSGLTK